MAFTADEITFFKLALLDKLLTRADKLIRPQIPSRRLSAAMRKVFDVSKRRSAKGALFIPHYWAVMLHDGHRSFKARSAKFLVYFVEEADDPRGPSPERAADEKKLTRGQFDEGMDENRRLESFNPAGGPMQHMIVVKTPSGAPGRVKASTPARFFSEGGKAFELQAGDLIADEFDAFVRRNLVSETLTARFII